MSAAHDTLELLPDAQAVPRAVEWVEGIARRESWPPKIVFALTLCLDEALTNVVSYAFDATTPAPAVTLRCRRAGPDIELELRDNGRPYDPTASETPALAASLDDASMGGHGVRLMRHYLQALNYRHEGDWNCLTMTLALGQAQSERS